MYIKLEFNSYVEIKRLLLSNRNGEIRIETFVSLDNWNS